MAYRLSLIIITLWAGALWTTGISAYVLFDTLQDKQMAGMLAGKLFTVVSYIGMVSAFYLLIHRLIENGTAALKQSFFWAVFLMLLLILAGHFGIQPILEGLKTQALPADVMQSVFADRFKTWHGVASVAYLLECLLALVMVLKSR
jgi:cytochrome bd-type quinol oxidase subunit 1